MQTPAQRLPYSAPQLHDHGTIRDITLAGPNGTLNVSDSTLYSANPTPSLS